MRSTNCTDGIIDVNPNYSDLEAELGSVYTRTHFKQKE